MDTVPTIKGIFVNSHIKALQDKKGKEAALELEKRYGGNIKFSNDEDVPIREEVRIIEYVLDILSQNSWTDGERAYEAGKLHFENFCNTPLAKILFSIFSKKFKLLMMQSKNLAGHIFKGVKFDSKDIGDKGVQVIMENNDYPLEHFKGFFQAWMNFAGLKGIVSAEQKGTQYIYTMIWE